MCIRDRDKAEFEFIYYYLKTQYYNLRNLSSGVRKNLNSNDIKNFEIFLPNLATQKQIAKVLSDLDAKIEVNNKINKELEAMAKTLYDYWFVQFDFPDVKGKPYKSSGGKMVFNESLKREIPEGWGLKSLDEVAEIKRGKLLTAKTADLDGYIKVVSAGVAYSYCHSASNRLENTITVSGSGANAGYINFWREPIYANDCTTVRGKTDAETLVILQFLNIRQEFIMSQARGSAQPHVYPKDLAVLKIAIPDNDLFHIYGKKVLPLNQKIANNLKQNKELKELRDWLLPMLMNGQVTVNQAYEKIKEPLNIAAEERIAYKKPTVLTLKEQFPDPYEQRQRFSHKKKTKRLQVLTTSRIIDYHQKSNQKLGHTKAEKINHAIEYITQTDLARDAIKHKGGPVDFVYLKRFVEPMAKKRNVFEAIKVEDKYHYEKGENFDLFVNESYTEPKLAPVSDKIDDIINSFLYIDLNRTELYMTVYAGWNNLLIRQQSPSFENIVMESLDNWTGKRKKFNEDDVQEAIDWLKEKNYEPKGYGKEVK